MHSTDDLEDGYIGSGKRLWNAIRKHGRENFEVEHLEFFESRELLIGREKELVNEALLKDPMCMNLKPGGEGGLGGMKTVKDLSGKCFNVFKDDPRLLTGEVVSVMSGLIVVKDKNNKKYAIQKNDPRYLSGELVSMHKDMVIVKDRDDNLFSVSVNDPRYLSGELIPRTKGLITVKDKDDNLFSVSVDDPRFLSGELVGQWKDRNHKQETKVKMSEKAKLRIGDKNSQFGTCWIKKDNINMKIKKTQLHEYEMYGWIKGRIINKK
jgi:hypothetical protein